MLSPTVSPGTGTPGQRTPSAAGFLSVSMMCTATKNPTHPFPHVGVRDDDDVEALGSFVSVFERQLHGGQRGRGRQVDRQPRRASLEHTTCTARELWVKGSVFEAWQTREDNKTAE